MVDPKASRFWQVALQSGLIDEEGLNACFAAIVPEKRVAEHIDRRMARQAVQQGRLTLWQVQQLMAGRSSGFKIDRYMLLELIGQGGMGRVYLARDTRLNRRVALKILSPERMNNPRAIARFQREARVGAQLQHENLVRIYDEGEANGKCYLVMEYIEGKTIGAIIAENGPIPPASAARLARQVALGLEHAQQKGLIHRDVNPYNILVTRDGVAKLTDLGLAIDQTEQAQVTREGATVGTFDYVSPEQARHSHAVDTRSDIYSLGCTLYHMLSGQVPFPCPSLPEKLFGHQAVEPELLEKLVPGIPAGLAAVVRKMMRKSPDDRHPRPMDVALALEPYTDHSAGAMLPGASASRSGTSARPDGRPPLSETQIVIPPPVAAAAPVAAALATRADEVGPPSSSSSGADPSPVPSPSASRSNVDWGDLGLEIDLGPEPSLTEGLASSRKKKPRSSVDLAASAAATPEPAPTPTPTATPADAPRSPMDWDVADAPATGADGLAGLGLALDLGPEPPLSTRPQAQAHAKAPAPVTPGVATASAPQASPRGYGRRWLIGAGALGAAAVAVAAGALFGFGLLGGAGSNSNGPSRTTDAANVAVRPSQHEAEDKHGHRPGRGGPKAGAAREVPAGQDFAVRTPDGTVVPEPNLKGALQRAIGSRGQVLLNNREPIRLTGPDATINGISGGRLSIRAAEGVQPVLEVEIEGKTPFLSTRTDTPLSIVGVTIVARYRGTPKVAPALIQAGGNVTLDRCAFTATGAVKDSRAVVAEGGSLEVKGCWFEGFDTAIDVASFSGSTAIVRQSMMVRAHPKAKADDPASGWAVRVRRTPGGAGKAGRRLVLEHCTVKGAGLLDLVDFSPQAPAQVEIKACAAMAEALLSWQTPKPGTPLTAEALGWKGRDNQYDIRGKAWIVQGPEGSPELPDGPTDLASWRSRMEEVDPLPPPIRFQVSPESLSESPRPRDFALIDQDANPPGADPDHVGPGAAPTRP
jgi:serine/threonine-protein kinase